MTPSIPRLFMGSAIAAMLWTATVAAADGLQSLDAFIRHSRTGGADFTQTMTAPAREGQAARVKTSSGRFEFQRPNRFRFDYQKPFVQTIVADGKTLWLYDADLNQVTQREQAQVLVEQAINHIQSYGEKADLLRAIARYVVERDR